MRNIKILKTMDAAPDGIHLETYEEGRIESMPDDLADVFVKEGWGVEVNPVETAGGMYTHSHPSPTPKGGPHSHPSVPPPPLRNRAATDGKKKVKAATNGKL